MALWPSFFFWPSWKKKVYDSSSRVSRQQSSSFLLRILKMAIKVFFLLSLAIASAAVDVASKVESGKCNMPADGSSLYPPPENTTLEWITIDMSKAPGVRNLEGLMLLVAKRMSKLPVQILQI